LGAEKNRRRKQKKKQSRRDRHEDEQFKQLSVKMVGLSNMISLMSVSKHSGAVQPYTLEPNKLGGMSEIGSKFGAFCYFPGMTDQSKQPTGNR